MPNTNVNHKQLTEREVWPDILRILAAFAVILFHAANPEGYNEEYSGDFLSPIRISNFFQTFTRFAVPVFVMISGYFLLRSENTYDISKIARKIIRIVIAFMIWSTFYATVDFLRFNTSPWGLLDTIIRGHYHMWFLFMICGLYLATPILQLIVKNEKLNVYFILLSITFIFFSNILKHIPTIGTYIELYLKRIDFNIITGYSIYYLLGSYLSNHNIQEKIRYMIYLMALISIIITLVISDNLSAIDEGKWIHSHFLPNILIITIAIFIFCKYNFTEVSFSSKSKKMISTLGRLTFGIYLIHAFILEHLYLIGMPYYFIHPAFSIPITSLVTFLISLAIVWVLDKIPVINKYAL